jgi:hypothetical protein
VAIFDCFSCDVLPADEYRSCTNNRARDTSLGLVTAFSWPWAEQGHVIMATMYPTMYPSDMLPILVRPESSYEYQ